MDQKQSIEELRNVVKSLQKKVLEEVEARRLLKESLDHARSEIGKAYWKLR